MKERTASRKRTGTKIALYLLVFFFVSVSSWISFWASRGGTFPLFFSPDYGDSWMDYFSMLALAGHGDPYAHSANYPPMCFALLSIAFHFVPADHIGADAFSLRNYLPAVLPFLVAVITCILVVGMLSGYMLRNLERRKRYFAVASICLSGPVLFALERGNLILLVLACLVTFAAFYDSEKATRRWIAYLSIGLATAIKLYPIVFVLMVWVSGRKKEALLCFAVSIAFLAGPSIFYGGIDAFFSMCQGIASSSVIDKGLGLNYSAKNFVRMLFALCGVRVDDLSSFISLGGAAVALLVFFTQKERWRRMFALGLLCVWVPSFSFTYTLVLFVPALLLFLGSNACERYDECFSVMFALLFAVYALPVIGYAESLFKASFPLAGGCVVGNFVLAGFVVLMFADRTRRAKSNSANAVQGCLERDLK